MHRDKAHMLEIVNRKSEWLHMNDEAIRKREEELKGFSDEEIKEAESLLPKLQEAIEKLVSSNAPMYENLLLPESTVGTAPGLPELLEHLRVCNGGTDPLKRRSGYEAALYFDLLMFLLLMRRQDSHEKARKDLYGLVREMEPRLFSGSRKIITYMYQDPDPDAHMMVKRVTIDHPLRRTSLLERRVPLICRVFRNHPIFFHHRPKRDVAAALKADRQNAQKKKDPFIIRDRRGLMMACEEVVRPLLIEAVIQVVEEIGGRIRYVEQDGHNAYSSGGYQKEEFQIWWAPNPRQEEASFELQILTLEVFGGGQLSGDETNHALYRLKQARDYFKWIFPKAVYGINWEDPKVKAELWRQRSSARGLLTDE